MRHPPDLSPARHIIASSVNETAKQERKPSLVGDVLRVLTIKLIITKTKVQTISIIKAFQVVIFGVAGSN